MRWPAHPLFRRALLFPRQVSREQILAFQNKCLRRLVRHAWENVPYYRRLFDTRGVRPGDIRSADDLAALPVTTKDDLRALPLEERMARGLDPAGLAADSTSGATGEPFTTLRTRAERRATFPFWFRAKRSMGLRLTDRQAMVDYAPDGHGWVLPFYRRAAGWLGVHRRLQVHCGLPEDQIIRALREYRPDFIQGYAGTLTHIARVMLHAGETGIRPHLVLAGAEVMTAPMRADISRAFGADVYEAYGAHEFSLIAWECREAGGYHVCDDNLILEVIKDGRPPRAKPARWSERPCTRLLCRSSATGCMTWSRKGPTPVRAAFRSRRF